MAIDYDARNRELVRRHKAGDGSALDEMLRLNRGAILKVARDARLRLRCRADEDDAMGAATLGLLRAIRDYDPAVGGFLTYARPWIRYHLQRLTLCRLPVHVPKYLYFGTDGGNRGRRPEVVAMVRRATRAVVIETSQARKRSGQTLADAIPDAKAGEVYREPADAERFLAILRPREREILRAHLGFDGEPQNFSAIAGRMGTGRSYPGEVYRESVNKLRRWFGPEKESYL